MKEDTKATPIAEVGSPLPAPGQIERLNRGLQTGVKLTLGAAPAGYGKTTALAQWAHASPAPRVVFLQGCDRPAS